MSSHTPGPWKFNPMLSGHRSAMDVEFKRNRRGYLKIGTDEIYAGDASICRVYDKTNAPIIACAPEMLEALENLVRTNGKQNKLWDDVRALIVKAGGRK